MQCHYQLWRSIQAQVWCVERWRRRREEGPLVSVDEESRCTMGVQIPQATISLLDYALKCVCICLSLSVRVCVRVFSLCLALSSCSISLPPFSSLPSRHVVHFIHSLSFHRTKSRPLRHLLGGEVAAVVVVAIAVEAEEEAAKNKR